MNEKKAKKLRKKYGFIPKAPREYETSEEKYHMGVVKAKGIRQFYQQAKKWL